MLLDRMRLNSLAHSLIRFLLVFPTGLSVKPQAVFVLAFPPSTCPARRGLEEDQSALRGGGGGATPAP